MFDDALLEIGGESEGGFDELEFALHELTDDQSEYGDDGEWEFAGWGDAEEEGVFDESEEMELAAELLTVSGEAQLDQFLGKAFRKVRRVAGHALRSPIGHRLKQVLRPMVRRALPMAGGAVGSVFGGPAGRAAGARIASAAGRVFGLELEGLSPEDQEFEVARRVVRLVGEAATKAANAPTLSSPDVTARQAVAAAARQHAPGLLRAVGATGGEGGRRSAGRWIRRGRTIIVLGA